MRTGSIEGGSSRWKQRATYLISLCEWITEYARRDGCLTVA